jgi:mono/diheme cytochrome c family protein
MKITSEVMARGASRYQINCLPCHGHAGDGQGIVPLRGFPKMPSSFHEERLRVAPVGHFFNVITNGLGIMSGYAAQITPEDRYAIIAYVRALQLSQNVPASQLTAADKEKLAEETP